MVSTVSIYVDSTTLSSWYEYTDIGSVAMMAQGDELFRVADQIQDIDHVTNASITQTAKAYLRMDKNSYFVGDPNDPFDPIFLMVGQAYSLEASFEEKFPNEFRIVEGRYPKNSSEIAIPISDAMRWTINIGRMMNYSHRLNDEKRTVFCVGFFVVANNSIRATTTDAVAIVTSEVLNPDDTETRVYIDIDRTLISAFNPRWSLDSLASIETDIQRLNPSASQYTGILINNYLETGILSYLENISALKNHQISRAQSVILIAAMLTFLNVKLNMTLREKEINKLYARGASKKRCFVTLMTELLVLSIAGSIIGFFIAVNLNQIYVTSFSSLLMTQNANYDSKILVTFDSMFLVSLLALFLPFFGYITNRSIQTSRHPKSEVSRNAKITRTIRMIRWDVAIVLVLIILLFGPFSTYETLTTNSLILFIFIFSPFAIFLAIASLLSKGIGILTRINAKITKPFVGKLNSNLGMKSIQSSIRFSVPVILLVTLFLSGILTNIVSAESLLATRENNARFVIGGDITFSLNNDEILNWTDFFEVVQEQPAISAMSLLSVGQLSLSEGKAGLVEFVAINPEEYSHIGYTYTGNRIDASTQMNLIQELEENPEGAIITSDIAMEYGLVLGDTLRAISFGIDSDTVEFNIVGITTTLSKPHITRLPTSTNIEGYRRIWLNRGYISSLTDLNETSENYLCIKTESDADGVELANSILSDFTEIDILAEGWSAVTLEIDTYINQRDFIMDRELDTILSVLMVFCLVSVFLMYQISLESQVDRREAIVKIFGGSDNQVSKMLISETLSIIFISIIVLIVLEPVFLNIFLRLAQIEYETWSYKFPISLFIQSNIVSLFVIGLISLLPSLFLITFLIHMRSKTNISQTLAEMMEENILNGGS